LGNGQTHSNGHRAHRRAALVAVRLDPIEELLPVADGTQEVVKAARVAFPGTTLEAFHETTAKIQTSPLVTRQNKLGHRRRRLGVVRVATRFDAVPRMLAITR